jgi:hypothetical protein
VNRISAVGSLEARQRSPQPRAGERAPKDRDRIDDTGDRNVLSFSVGSKPPTDEEVRIDVPAPP